MTAMAKIKNISFHAQAEQNNRDEAERLARATQSQGQSKQQTKLIAQGIAKGIVEYKKKEKAKSRQFDRERKKRAKQETTRDSHQESRPSAGERSKTALLFTACVIFAAISASHLLRYFLGARLIVGNFPVPQSWSLLTSIVAGALACWMFVAARR